MESGKMERILPQYSGSSDPEKWFKIVERVAKKDGWKPEDYPSNTSIFLVGEALSYAEENNLDTKGWQVFKDTLTRRFTKKVERVDIYAALLSMKKKPTEDVRAFGDRIRTVAKTSVPAIDERDIKRLYLRGLPIRFHTLSFGDNVSYDELIESVKAVDLLGKDGATISQSMSSPESVYDLKEDPGSLTFHGNGKSLPSSTKEKPRCEICRRNNHSTEECFYNPNYQHPYYTRSKDKEHDLSNSHKPHEQTVGAIDSIQPICQICNQAGHTALQCPTVAIVEKP